jgi:hypothetical protein
MHQKTELVNELKKMDRLRQEREKALHNFQFHVQE